MPRIARTLSSKPVDADAKSIAETLNREVIPLLREIRAALGANGTLRYGETAPDDSLGDDGDLYINLTGPTQFTKVGGTWV
jgi:hypothetical protein